jgi:hypothetical protein
MKRLILLLCLLLFPISSWAVLVQRSEDPSIAAAIMYYLDHTHAISPGWKHLFHLQAPFDVSDLAAAKLAKHLQSVVQLHLTASADDSCMLYATAVARISGRPYANTPYPTYDEALLACYDGNLYLPPWNPPVSPQAKALKLATEASVVLKTDPALSTPRGKQKREN